MSNLTELISTTLRWCQRHPGRNHQRLLTLPGGLSLMLYVDAEGLNHVKARRLAPSRPSEMELNTLMRHWPQQPAPLMPWATKSGPHLDVEEGSEQMVGGGASYNCLYFQWKPETPQPFAGDASEPSARAMGD